MIIVTHQDFQILEMFSSIHGLVCLLHLILITYYLVVTVVMLHQSIQSHQSITVVTYYFRSLILF